MTTPTTTPNLPRLRRALAAAIGCEEGALLASSPRPGASWPRHLAAALCYRARLPRAAASAALGYTPDSYTVVARQALRRLADDPAAATRYAAARAALVGEGAAREALIHFATCKHAREWRMTGKQPLICTLGEDLAESERQAAALQKLRERYADGTA